MIVSVCSPAVHRRALVESTIFRLCHFFKCATQKPNFHGRISMIAISASELRKNFFKYLDMLSEGEPIVVLRNKRKVAHLTPIYPTENNDDIILPNKIRQEAIDSVYDD
jgi:antitoxin (DNA-binding transcriptional repressor) of toxin-antitoxin stability system